MEPERLLSHYFQGMLTDEEFDQLQAWLRSDPDHIDQYVKASFLNRSIGDLIRGEGIQENICKSKLDFDIFADHRNDSAVWQALLEVERTAPRIEKVPETSASSMPLQEKQSKQSKKMNRFWPTMAMFSSIAALLLVLLGVVDYVKSQRVVATLHSNVHAKWAETPEVNELRVGYFELQEGVAEIHFKKGTHVIVQAPCAFDLRSNNSMELWGGTISAEVPQQAQGFLIETLWSDITDYGTAFGVSVDTQQDADIHVFEGEVGVQSTIRKHRRQIALLKKGQNARTDQKAGVRLGQALHSVNQYIRNLPIPHQLAIPGKTLSLADLLGGGNGYGTGVISQGYDSSSGEILRHPAFGIMGQDTPGAYHRVLQSSVIDGVFVPNGKQKPQVISSTGLVYSECPTTTGQYFSGIFNSGGFPSAPDSKIIVGSLNGIHYDSLMYPAITMNTNAGITFDLDQIRRNNPGVTIDSFHAICGVSETVVPYLGKKNIGSTVDFWILADGEVREHYSCTIETRHTKEVTFLINEDVRFLTLMTTDNGKFIGNGWGMFAEPVLVLKSISK